MHQQDLPSGATFLSLGSESAEQRNVVQAQNFSVEWIRAHDKRASVESGAEVILILPDGVAQVSGQYGRTRIEGSSVAILPAGAFELELVAGDLLLVLATDRGDLHRADSAAPAHDDRIAPIGQSFVRSEPLEQPLVMAFDAIANPSGNPRIRFVQSATMSINLVRYEGARDTSALSPHAHTDVEQGTLAIHGCYVHHLRTPWSPDLTAWRDDEHLEAGPGTLLLIPPELVHTTQGVGAEKHLMLDIFAPPRRDFIAKGWMTNAGDYRDPARENAAS